MGPIIRGRRIQQLHDGMILRRAKLPRGRPALPVVHCSGHRGTFDGQGRGGSNKAGLVPVNCHELSVIVADLLSGHLSGAQAMLVSAASTAEPGQLIPTFSNVIK